MRTILLLIALTLAGVGCGSDPPPVDTAKEASTFVSCPTGWYTTEWHWACYPSNNVCNFFEYRLQYLVNGRIVEQSWYHDLTGTHGGDSYNFLCLDTSPWPTSYTGPVNVYRFDDAHTIYSWKREMAGQGFDGCHCYTSTDGFHWSSRTCFAWECY